MTGIETNIKKIFTFIQKHYKKYGQLPSLGLASEKTGIIEAGLEEGVVVEQVKDRDLLMDLIRIEEEFGETPTYALIEQSGKFSKEDYENRWRNLDDAFKLAKSKYDKKLEQTPDKTVLMSKGAMDIQSPDKTMIPIKKKNSSKGTGINMEETLVSVKKDDMGLEESGSGEFRDDFGSNSILTIDEMDNKKKIKEKKDEPEPSFDYQSDDDGGIENLMAINVQKRKKKKIIPETIKPSGVKSEKEQGEPLDFRGIKFTPIDTRGVIFLFGMVSEELNFVVESFGSDKFCFSGKRNRSSKEEKWEKVNVGFALNSLDLEKSGRLTKNCELLICWKHGWKNCPAEVLELSSTLPLLENY